MKRVLHEHCGRLLLILSLVWMGLVMALFRVRPASLPDEGALENYRERVGVAYVPGQLVPDEGIFPVRQADQYRRAEIGVLGPPPPPPLPPPPDLPLPTRAAIRPPPQILPDPGPSLEGADGLPRWGGEGNPLQRPRLPAR